MVFALFSCLAFSLPVSRLSAIISQTNSTIKGKALITGDYIRSPLFTNIFRSNPTQLHLTSFNIFRMAMPVVSARSNMALTISKTSFKNSMSPIRISGVDRSKLKPFTARKARTNMQLTLRDVLFDFCNSPTEDGGSLFCDNCQVSINDVEFVSSIAAIGGGFYAKHSEISMQSTSFFKCCARKEGGGFFAKGCKLHMSKSFVVANKADGKYGGFYQSDGTVRIYDNAIEENKATLGYGGATFEHSTGQLFQNKFRGNDSPGDDVGGTALYVPSTIDYFMVEYCTFFGKKMYIKYGSNAGIRISECCFDVTFELVSAKEGKEPGVNSNEVPYILNNYYTGCPPPPKLPARFYKELFYHSETAPVIEWWKLYAGLGIFIVLLGVLALSVQSIFFPLVAKGATRKGEKATV